MAAIFIRPKHLNQVFQQTLSNLTFFIVGIAPRAKLYCNLKTYLDYFINDWDCNKTQGYINAHHIKSCMICYHSLDMTSRILLCMSGYAHGKMNEYNAVYTGSSPINHGTNMPIINYRRQNGMKSWQKKHIFLWLHGILWNSNATLRRVFFWVIGFKYNNISQKHVGICCVTHSQKMTQQGFVLCFMMFLLLVYNTL